MFKAIGILLILTVAYASAQLCGLESCGSKEHIDCTRGTEAGSTLAPYCNEQESVTMLNLGGAQQMILDTFNNFRNRIALGNENGFAKAVRMCKMRWNVTLANLGRKNVRNCVSEHDECRNTPDFNYCGQFLGYSKHPPSDTRDNTQIVKDIMQYWLEEIQNTTQAEMDKYPGTVADRKISDVAHIIRDDACRVGCGALKYTEPDDKDRVVLIACNTDVGVVKNYPVYIKGTTASKCKTGKDSTHKGLCTTDEPILPNKFWDDD